MSEAVDLLERAVNSQAPKAEILAIMARSINLPKPLMAVAYLQLNKMTDAQLQEYSRLAIDLIRRIETGEPINDVLAGLGIPAELEGLIKQYGAHFTKNNSD